MAFLGREKTIVRKIREAMGTLLLESMLTKDEILTWYINLAEFGDGIYGLRAAASHYYQTKPELLTIQQAANLAVVLPSPNGWSIGLRRRNLTAFGQRRYATIVTQMFRSGYITQTQWLNALATGNFGRPVAAYERFRVRERSTAKISSSDDDAQDVEPSEEEASDE
jgi:membrane peptidoglycan carboxypeptidase